MSVVPDRLLNPAPDVKAKAATPRAATPAAEPGSRDSASFSKVYERERQSRTSEAPASRSTSDANRKTTVNGKAEAANETSPAEQALAESGNVLPGEPTEPSADTLLMLGLGETEAEVPSDEDDSEETATPLPAAASLFVPPPSVDPTRIDPEMEKLNSAAAVKLTLELDGRAKQSAEGKAPVEIEALADASEEASPEAGLESLLSAELPTEEKTEPVAVSRFADALKDLAGDSRSETNAGRLNALAQQINPQLATGKAMPVVPGQPVPMQQGGWSEAVVDRVMWLSSQNLKSAEIQLDPAELGRLEVRINMNQDLAQVTFASANPNVRDALESQMHRLRELFTQQGMGQLDVNVSDQSLDRGWQGDARQARQAGPGGESGGEEELGAAGVETGVSNIRADRGLVDYYA